MARSRAVKLARRCLGGILIVSMIACSHSPSKRYSDIARKHALIETTIETAQFDLQLFSNNLDTPTKLRTLNVYLEGDGHPFIRRRFINQDPTSRQALGLKLMQIDPYPAVLIGRPCYHLYGSARNCQDPKWWTSHRYANEIVSALNDAIQQLIKTNNVKTVRLIGFSGGGTLAVLLAPHIEQLDDVVAINPNLNIDAWTQRHNFTSLAGSMNPVDMLEKVPADLRVRLLVGLKDTNVVYTDWSNATEKFANISVKTYPLMGHSHGWVPVWKSFLNSNFTAESKD